MREAVPIEPDTADDSGPGEPSGPPGRARIGKGAPSVPARLVKGLVAVLVGVGVVLVAAIQLRGGPTIGGVPLEAVPVDEVSGFERLFADELVVLLTWGLVLLAAFLVASLVRGILDDQWLRRFGTGGAEIGDPAGVAASDVEQSKVLTQLIEQVAALERDALADRQAAEEIFLAIEALTEELDQARAGAQAAEGGSAPVGAQAAEGGSASAGNPER